MSKITMVVLLALMMHSFISDAAVGPSGFGVNESSNLDTFAMAALKGRAAALLEFNGLGDL